MHNDQKEIAKLVSLTFDSNPHIRISAARKLSDSSDPAALLALLELANDKNKEVSKVAYEILEKTKLNKPDMLPLTELFKGVDFSGGAAKAEAVPAIDSEEEIKRKERIIDPIQKAFERSIGKERADQLKPKLVELAFKHSDKSTVQNLLTQLLGFYTSGSKEEKKETKAVAVSPVAHIEQKEEQKIVPSQIVEQVGFTKEEEPESEEIGKEAELVNVDDMFSEEEKKVIEEGEPSIIKQAYDSMLVSEGDEKLIEHQAETMKKYLGHQVDIAFKLARRKFKEIRLTDITNIRNGMKNITTDILLVKKVEQKQYSRTKSSPREFYTRIIAVDPDGKEGVIYLFEGRGKFMAEGMNIYLEKAKSKTFKFSGETVLTVDNKRGKVHAVF
ncbi:MAG: hypothetical protein NTY68_02330 [Candidatus Micrarchaeota archaeon]|nr:hypothetical protein [Candidatus Micrarchaeota archaeon]